ncbi:hypothetical protein GGI42DRAFT_216948 [Trichoderma sp. SZMC 28013]
MGVFCFFVLDFLFQCFCMGGFSRTTMMNISRPHHKRYKNIQCLFFSTTISINISTSPLVSSSPSLSPPPPARSPGLSTNKGSPLVKVRHRARKPNKPALCQKNKIKWMPMLPDMINLNKHSSQGAQMTTKRHVRSSIITHPPSE